ncbi:MAG: alpha/beta hydrolase [Tannerella sp.]|jgi:acetyl esterase/lipase|nr:alpha/beta hydrolase [Tannerella sp.]
MKRVLFILLAASCGLGLKAQEPDSLAIWPGDASKAAAEMFIYHPNAKAQTPTAAVLVFPGGGYRMLAMDTEGSMMARWYAAHGLTAVVVRYRMPEGVRTVPLDDAVRAMQILRAHAAAWNIDPKKVGAVGSSAGGHLAASLCTLAPVADRPDFAVLYYPVISFETGITHLGSRNNLLGKDKDDPKWIAHYSLDKQVDAHTPPTLMMLADDDNTVPPENSLLYYEALKRQHIRAALYIFPFGGHGFGFKDSYAYQAESRRLLAGWLQSLHLL